MGKQYNYDGLDLTRIADHQLVSTVKRLNRRLKSVKTAYEGGADDLGAAYAHIDLSSELWLVDAWLTDLSEMEDEEPYEHGRRFWDTYLASLHPSVREYITNLEI